MKFLSKYMFIIIGTLVLSLILWRVFMGNITLSTYAQEGALFEEIWYTGNMSLFDGVDTKARNSSDADARPITLRRFMQDYWLTYSGLNGLESQYIHERNWHDMSDSSTSSDSATSADALVSFWSGIDAIPISSVTVSEIEVPSGGVTVPANTGVVSGGGTVTDPTGGGGGGGSTLPTFKVKTADGTELEIDQKKYAELVNAITAYGESAVEIDSSGTIRYIIPGPFFKNDGVTRDDSVSVFKTTSKAIMDKWIEQSYLDARVVIDGSNLTYKYIVYVYDVTNNVPSFEYAVSESQKKTIDNELFKDSGYPKKVILINNSTISYAFETSELDEAGEHTLFVPSRDKYDKYLAAVNNSATVSHASGPWYKAELSYYWDAYGLVYGKGPVPIEGAKVFTLEEYNKWMDTYDNNFEYWDTHFVKLIDTPTSTRNFEVYKINEDGTETKGED